ncbi:LLM class flavin-dependent oxidoreductase [Kocuria rosea]|uniref:LLM class flavin-dependent oxidoreductase n=1 Tax=Kocuria rosea TaxID=1275 RepID=UPI00203F754E|nr:LLM class flavin-dependent oxidoreductase [Kocuria rosea]MCM3689155.1 LLM class flavin-dependent oxidoreductase [Kocuria rosea]
MTELTFHWFLPTAGDSRNIVSGGHGAAVRSTGSLREPSLDYLTQVARAAEHNGFDAVLTPTGTWCRDAWLTTAALIPATERLRFLVAFRPGLISPTLSAQMAATFQKHSAGRLLLNVVVGGESPEQRAYGDFHDKDARYGRADEFLDIVARLWAGERVNLDGQHLRVENAQLQQLPDPLPGIYFGGSSPAAATVAARHADVYLTWGEPPAQAAEKIETIRHLAAAQGRTVRFGIRLHTITRDTSEAAWTEAARLLEAIPEELVAQQQAKLRESESEGQRRMLELNAGDRTGLEIHPNLWAGVGLVRGGAGTAMVGSHQEVAELIKQYAAVGFEEFVLSGYPCLEEAYWFGEGVLPLLEAEGLWTRPGTAARHLV